MITLLGSFFAPPRHLILLLAALWIGLSLAEKRAEQHNVGKDQLTNMVYYSLFGYILGGRLFYALANFSAFVQSPLSLFSLNLDLFDPAAGLAVALLVGFAYGFRQKLALWPALDALTPLFATLPIGLSLAHLASGAGFGRPTDLPWGINLWNATRHPSQIYELVASLLIFGLILFRKRRPRHGFHFLAFVAWTAAARLFLEAFRGDSTLTAGGLRIVQIVAWIVLAAALTVSEWIQGGRKAESET